MEHNQSNFYNCIWYNKGSCKGVFHGFFLNIHCLNAGIERQLVWCLGNYKKYILKYTQDDCGLCERMVKKYDDDDDKLNIKQTWRLQKQGLRGGYGYL